MKTFNTSILLVGDLLQWAHTMTDDTEWVIVTETNKDRITFVDMKRRSSYAIGHHEKAKSNWQAFRNGEVLLF